MTNIIYLPLPLVAVACFALAPTVKAVTPAPDGDYPGANTAEGENALFSLTRGGFNTAVGWSALYHDTTGYVNTAVGASALVGNTRGFANTAVGVDALQLNSTGFQNTATGDAALAYNDGVSNTANGYRALHSNTRGNNNTALGVSAMDGHPDVEVTGSNNTATGYFALFRYSTGNGNTANGVNALLLNTSGNNNTAIGQSALSNNTTGDHNIALGASAGVNLTTGVNNIDIGNRGAAGESDAIRIGNQGIQKATYVAGIFGATVTGGAGVMSDNQGHLGTLTSSVRFKEAIKPMNETSEAILALKPVSFRYKHELDPAGIPQFGLVAEEVEKVNPDLVVRDEAGKPYSVRYEAVNAMLLNEFLKEHQKVQELKEAVATQEQFIVTQQQINARQQKQIETLSAGLEKVSTQLQLQHGRLQTVAVNH